MGDNGGSFVEEGMGMWGAVPGAGNGPSQAASGASRALVLESSHLLSTLASPHRRGTGAAASFPVPDCPEPP